MNNTFLIILCLIIIIFFKDIVTVLIALCILSFCLYYFMSNDNYLYMKNILTTSENK
jgi:hypothetical protein